MKEATGKKLAKLCYEHIGGKLGSLLLVEFIAKGWLSKADDGNKNLYITDKGIKEFTNLGIDLSQIKA